MKLNKISFALALCAILVFTGCGKKITIPVEKLTSSGYLTLLEYNDKGKYGPVIILPERHDSRLIQAEFGWAMNILFEDCGINTIALEGMYHGETMTGVKPVFETEKEKYEVLLSVLEQGNIKAPEFMYLAKNSFVFGIENEAEYALKPTNNADNAINQSLLLSVMIDLGYEVLEPYLENDDIDFVAILALNPWTWETYEILCKGLSLTDTIDRLKELEDKTWSLLNTRARSGFKELKEFYVTAYKRSFTMAENVYNRLVKNNSPLVMVIGAAHTEDITAYFNEKNVSYYVFEPSGLNMAGIWSDLAYAEYEKKSEGESVFMNEQLVNFFEEGRNSRPTYDMEWIKNQFAFTSLIGNLINNARPWPPADNQIWNTLENDKFRFIREFVDVSNLADIKCAIVNNKGERVYVRIVEENNINIQGLSFVNLETAFRDMIDRLSQIDDQNLSLEQRVKAYEGIIEVINFKQRIILISPNESLLTTPLTQI